MTFRLLLFLATIGKTTIMNVLQILDRSGMNIAVDTPEPVAISTLTQ